MSNIQNAWCCISCLLQVDNDDTTWNIHEDDILRNEVRRQWCPLHGPSARLMWYATSLFFLPVTRAAVRTHCILVHDCVMCFLTIQDCVSSCQIVFVLRSASAKEWLLKNSERKGNANRGNGVRISSSRTLNGVVPTRPSLLQPFCHVQYHFMRWHHRVNCCVRRDKWQPNRRSCRRLPKGLGGRPHEASLR
jgi:hypothetical protein